MDGKFGHQTARHREVRPRGSDRDALVIVSTDRRADEVEFGSGWYHEAAIKESEQAHARQR